MDLNAIKGGVKLRRTEVQESTGAAQKEDLARYGTSLRNLCNRRDCGGARAQADNGAHYRIHIMRVGGYYF